MNKKILIGLISLIIIGLLLGFYVFDFSGKKEINYKTAEITRGDIESTISSTGTLSPVTTVEVGTQVSGTIAEVFVDYNNVVEKGELLAVLDTVMLKAAVLDAQAGVEKAEAQLELAQADYDRNLSLYNNKLISESDFLTFNINLKTQKASLESAKANLQRAKQNLEYAYIYSPINGTVIQKNVEAGQTVAASLSTPTLFIIAEDLSRMEILAAVDESDIGQIKVGLPVQFTVQAYPDMAFNGEVTQIRLQPTTVSNVVTYTVVINSSNQESLLLPGMTATVEFITAQQKNALLVPNAALRFQPPENVMAAFSNKKREAGQTGVQTGKTPQQANTQGKRLFSGNMTGEASASAGQPTMGRIWYLDAKGNIMMEPVRTGISNGSKTAIMDGKNLEPGIKVITGLESGSVQDESSSKSPNRAFGGGRPPRF